MLNLKYQLCDFGWFRVDTDDTV